MRQLLMPNVPRCYLLTLEQNKNAFISAIKEFRYKNPDVLFIGYNGFGGDMENTVAPVSKNGRPTLAGNI